MDLGASNKVPDDVPIVEFDQAMDTARVHLGEQIGVAHVCRQLKLKGQPMLAKQLTHCHKRRKAAAHQPCQLARRIDNVLGPQCRSLEIQAEGGCADGCSCAHCRPHCRSAEIQTEDDGADVCMSVPCQGDGGQAVEDGLVIESIAENTNVKATADDDRCPLVGHSSECVKECITSDESRHRFLVGQLVLVIMRDGEGDYLVQIGTTSSRCWLFPDQLRSFIQVDDESG